MRPWYLRFIYYSCWKLSRRREWNNFCFSISGTFLGFTINHSLVRYIFRAFNFHCLSSFQETFQIFHNSAVGFSESNLLRFHNVLFLTCFPIIKTTPACWRKEDFSAQQIGQRLSICWLYVRKWALKVKPKFADIILMPLTDSINNSLEFAL